MVQPSNGSVGGGAGAGADAGADGGGCAARLVLGAIALARVLKGLIDW